MYVNPIFNNKSNTISHRGCLKAGFIPQKYRNQGISTWLIHESAFFRDLPILEYVANYLKQLNKPDINIVSGACSEGYELLSIKMLAEDKGLKTNCLGFDIGERILNKANSYEYTIATAPPKLGTKRTPAGYSDSFLFFANPETMTVKQRELKTLFDKNFISNPNLVHKFTISHQPSSTEVTLRPKKRENVKFIQGNLLEMDSFLKPASADVLFFKNAMYHLTYDEDDLPKPRGELREILGKAVYQIEKAIAPKGLFVLGDLWRDHYLDIGDETYNALNSNGFKPVYQRSVWQKK